MQFPSDLLYSKDHEWAKVQGDTVLIGVTDHAQNALGDIVFVELPKTGRELKSHETFGVLESIKAVSDVYSPVPGTVLEVNQAATQDPAVVNRAPYTDGWLVKLKLSDKNALKELMDASAYKKLVESLN